MPCALPSFNFNVFCQLDSTRLLWATFSIRCKTNSSDVQCICNRKNCYYPDRSDSIVCACAFSNSQLLYLFQMNERNQFNLFGSKEQWNRQKWWHFSPSINFTQIPHGILILFQSWFGLLNDRNGVFTSYQYNLHGWNQFFLRTYLSFVNPFPLSECQPLLIHNGVSGTGGCPLFLWQVAT